MIMIIHSLLSPSHPSQHHHKVHFSCLCLFVLWSTEFNPGHLHDHGCQLSIRACGLTKGAHKQRQRLPLLPPSIRANSFPGRGNVPWPPSHPTQFMIGCWQAQSCSRPVQVAALAATYDWNWVIPRRQHLAAFLPIIGFCLLSAPSLFCHTPLP